jgi:hypothetical protein
VFVWGFQGRCVEWGVALCLGGDSRPRRAAPTRARLGIGRRRPARARVVGRARPGPPNLRQNGLEPAHGQGLAGAVEDGEVGLVLRSWKADADEGEVAKSWVGLLRK